MVLLRNMHNNAINIAFIVLAFLIAGTQGDAAYMICANNANCRNHASCNLPLKVGTAIMVSTPAKSSTQYHIIVTRNGAPISSPYSYVAGDTATFAASTNADPTKEDFAIEINNGGYFSLGSCTGKVRIDQDGIPGTFIIPSSVPVGTIVSIWAGLAPDRVAVQITPTFDFLVIAATPAPSTPTPPPSAVPSFRRGAPTPHPTKVPSATPTVLVAPTNNPTAYLFPTANHLQSFQHACALTPQLSLQWTVTGGSTVAAQLILLGPTTNWFSAGIVAPGETKMVTSQSTPNQVWLSIPDQGAAGLYAMMGQSSRKIFQVAAPKLSGITTLTSTQSPQQSTMSLILSSVAEPAVRSVSLSGADTLIYAHSDQPWPAQHPKGAYGFAQVNWSGGSCLAVTPPLVTSPFIIWILVALVAILNSPHSPLRNNFLLMRLNAKKLPTNFMGISDFSYTGIIFIGLYMIINLVVFFVGLPSSSLQWADITMNSGNAAIMNFWIAIIPTSKVSLTYRVFGVPFERATKYHKICAHVGMTWALVHLLANWTANTDVFYSFAEFGDTQVVPVYGFVAFIMFAAMSLMAFEPIRRAQYDLFLIFHQMHFFGVLFIVLHTKSDASVPFLGFLPGILLQVADIVVKLHARAHPRRPAGCSIVGGDIVHLSLPFAAEAQPKIGQYYYLLISSVSWFQWHPFSISHVDLTARTVHFHIKNMGPGTWSGRLAALIKAGSDPCTVSLIGPYGNLSLDLQRYSFVTLVAGGIGITPWVAALEAVCRLREKDPETKAAPYAEMRSLHLIWVVRDLAIVEAFNARFSRLLDTVGSSLSHGSSFETTSPMLEQQQHLFNAHVLDVELAKVGEQSTTLRIDWSAIPPGMPTRGERGSVSPSAAAASTAGFITIDVYVTQKTLNSAVPAQLHPSISLHTGRPDVAAIISKSRVASAAASSGGRSCVLVCGPTPLSRSVVQAAVEAGVDSHAEVFSL